MTKKTFSAANLRKVLALKAPNRTFEIDDRGDVAIVSHKGANACITMTSPVQAAFEIDTFINRL